MEQTLRGGDYKTIADMDLIRSMVRGILTLDGAMGTQLLAQGKSGCLELINVEESAIVAALHEEYLEAGADIISTNTTCVDALSLSQYGLQERSYELALSGAKIARAAADRFSTTENPRYVAGAVGPTTRNISLANDTTPEELAQAYSTVIKALIDGGVDMLLIETAMDPQNVKVAIEQARLLSADMPIVVSAVLSRIEGRVASGATIAKFLEDIPMTEVTAVGFNCSDGVRAMAGSLKILAAECRKPIIAYPSAGREKLAANRFAKELEPLCRAGLVNIVGGCCGTTPEHIKAVAKVARRWRPRKFENK